MNSAPAKPPPKKSGGGWGSLLSGAVAGLESRLDTILAEDGEASARQRASETALKEAKNGNRQRTGSGNLSLPAQGGREASRTRVNERLAERLAKATAAKGGSGSGSQVPSRVASPANEAGSARASGEVGRDGEGGRSVQEAEEIVDGRAEEKVAESGTKNNGEAQRDDAGPEGGLLQTSALPINPAKVSTESSRPSIELSTAEHSARTSSEAAPNGHPPRDPAELEAELAQLREDHAAAEEQRQEEMHAYLEKIDALQAKLQYLAKETVAAAKAANAESAASSDAVRLAEKDERIALLMEEGEKLSKTELRHAQMIKKLRAKSGEEEKVVNEVRRKLERAEKAEAELKLRLRKAELAERQAGEKARQIGGIEKQVEELRVDRENASELIRTLSAQLKEAKERAERAEKEANVKAAEIDRNRIAALENEVEDARIEKKLAEDRAAAETKRLLEEGGRERERFAAREREFKNEIAGLEGRVEAMRARAEEGETGGGGEGGSGVQLMRQVEMLQTQYTQAKENWETIEGSLGARVAVLEGEKDEAVRREAEVRRKAREAAAGHRGVEDELEGAREEARALAQGVSAQQDEVGRVARKLGEAETRLADAKADFARQRRVWEAELAQRLEEERAKWAQQQRGHMSAAGIFRAESPVTSRKASAADLPGLHTAVSSRMQRPISRRSSAMPSGSFHAPHVEASPAISRQESTTSFTTGAGMLPPTPSIEVENPADLLGENSSYSPQRPINDLVSTSTAGGRAAGPSVQLVERMSAAVRRLESEKASFKDEIARLSGQRDGARDEVVRLMREGDGIRRQGEDAERMKLEGELRGLRQRYEASLEMLGEREEEVSELREDLGEVKRLYRELVEERMPVR